MDHGEKELHDCQGRCCAENDGHGEIETCGGCAGGSSRCGGCCGADGAGMNGDCARSDGANICAGCAGGGCQGRAANGCGGCCPHAAGNEFEWDYDDTVLVFSSDMLEALP